MFYCEDCRKRNDWPDSLSLSRGQCEACGKTAHCYDRPSSTLPMPKRGEMTTVREAAKNILDLLDHGQPVSWEDIRALRHALEADTAEVPADATDVMLDAAFAATVWPDLDRATSADVMRGLRENMKKEYRAMIDAAKPETGAK